MLAGLSAAAAAHAAVVLQPPHVGVALAAPAAPAVGGSAPTSVAYSWRRCNRYTSLVKVDGATHFWQLGGDAGTSAPDFMGTAPGVYSRTGHASVSDGALDGETDPAATFDGTSDAISIAGAAAGAATAPYTIEAWVRPRLVDATPRYVFARESSTGTRQGTGLWLSTTGLTFERWTNGVKTAVTVGAGLPLHAWSLVTATYDGTTMRLFIDGKQLASRATAVAVPAVAAPTEIGSAGGGTSGFFAGDLDEVALYPLALARAHVAAHYAAGTTAPCVTIAGATSSSYTPVAADLGYEISATVT